MTIGKIRFEFPSEAAASLLPAQEGVYDKLKEMASSHPCVILTGASGRGHTTLLKRLARETDGAFIGAEEVLLALSRSEDEFAAMETIYALITREMRRRGTVVFDCCADYAQLSVQHRRGVVRAALLAGMRDLAVHEDRRLILADNVAAWSDRDRSFGEAAVMVAAPKFTMEDYQCFLERALGVLAQDIDFSEVFRAAPMLDLYQLDFLARLVGARGEIDTTALLEIIEKEVLHANLHIDEVEALTFEALPGTEAIAEALATHVVLPFENKQLAQKLNLKAKRGVLLFGPPGTGKTSIGRALAHQMKGRFFLIDGTIPTEPPANFFGVVDAIVREAKANSPCVLFIDDADVLFQIEHVAGLSRYLLSLLDGLESETGNNVCVVLTAMDAKKVPEALLRSGRVELWLELKAPSDEVRAKIIERWLVNAMAGFASVDHDLISAATEGFTPADLRRLAGDAKLLYARDIMAGRPAADANDYLLAAIADLTASREQMALRLAEDETRIRDYS